MKTLRGKILSIMGIVFFISNCMMQAIGYFINLRTYDTIFYPEGNFEKYYNMLSADCAVRIVLMVAAIICGIVAIIFTAKGKKSGRILMGVVFGAFAVENVMSITVSLMRYKIFSFSFHSEAITSNIPEFLNIVAYVFMILLLAVSIKKEDSRIFDFWFITPAVIFVTVAFSGIANIVSVVNVWNDDIATLVRVLTPQFMQFFSGAWYVAGCLFTGLALKKTDRTK